MQAPHCARPQPNLVPVRPSDVADRPEQRHVVVDIELVVASVDAEIDHLRDPLARLIVQVAIVAWAYGTAMSLGAAGRKFSGAGSAPAVAGPEQAQAQRVELDEARGVLLVVGAGVLLEGDVALGVERLRRARGRRRVAEPL